MKNSVENKYHVYIVAVLSMLFWGLSFIWSTIVLRYYSPVATIFLRLLISSAFLFFFLKISGKLQKVKREHYLLFLFSAIFNPFFYFLGENYGLKYSTPTIAAVVIATIPVFTPLVARYTLRERLPWVNLLGILISFVGIAVMLLNPDLSLNASYRGLAMLLIAVASAVAYSVFLKKLTVNYSAISIIAWQNLIGVALFLPFFLIFDLDRVLAIPLNEELVTSLLLLAVFASSFAFIFFTITIKALGVSRANVFSNLIPVFTGIFSYIFISEIFTINKIAGMLTVIFGVAVAQLRRAPAIKQT